MKAKTLAMSGQFFLLDEGLSTTYVMLCMEKKLRTEEKMNDEKAEEVLRWDDPCFASVWKSEDHSMLDDRLEAYVLSKVGCFRDSLVDARARQASLHVVGILKDELKNWLSEHGYSQEGALLDPRTTDRQQKKVLLYGAKASDKKCANTNRPFCVEAQKKDDGSHGLIFVVVPGRDYIVHFAQLLIQYTTKYLQLKTADPSELKLWVQEKLEVHIDAAKCRSLFSTLALKSSVYRRPDAKKHTVILGYVEFFFSFCEPKLRPAWTMEKFASWSDDNEFLVQELWNKGEKIQVSFLSVRHTYWGDISYYLAQALYRDCGVDEILYCAKLGVFNYPQRILTTLFLPSTFIVGEEKLIWKNCLSESAPTFGVRSSHWSVPTILDETKAKIAEVESQHGPFDSVDNEIGHIARAAYEAKKGFGAAHFATDFIHRYEKQVAAGESLNSTDVLRLEIMKTLQADCLVSYFTGKKVEMSFLEKLKTPRLLPRASLTFPPVNAIEKACLFLRVSNFDEVVDWVEKHDPLSYLTLRDQGGSFLIRYLYDLRSLTCAERLSNFDVKAISGRLHFWPVENEEVKSSDTVLVPSDQAEDARKELSHLESPSQVLKLPHYNRFGERWSQLTNSTIAEVLGLNGTVIDDQLRADVTVARDFVLKKLTEPSPPDSNGFDRRVAFKTVIVEGFGVFADKYEYVIGDSGVHLVTGELKNLQSNGFGKTTLSVSALLWCLSGLMEASISEYRKKPEHLLHRKADGTTVDEAWVEVTGMIYREDGFESTFSLKRMYKRGHSASATLVVGSKQEKGVSVSRIADELFSFSCDDEVDRRGEELKIDEGTDELTNIERKDGLQAAAFRDFLLGAIFWGRDSRCGFLKEDRRFKSALGILRPKDDRRQHILVEAKKQLAEIETLVEQQQRAKDGTQLELDTAKSEQTKLAIQASARKEASEQSLVDVVSLLEAAHADVAAQLEGAPIREATESVRSFVRTITTRSLKECAQLRALDAKKTGWEERARAALLEEYGADPLEAKIAGRIEQLKNAKMELELDCDRLRKLKLGHLDDSSPQTLREIEQRWAPLHDACKTKKKDLTAAEAFHRDCQKLKTLCPTCRQSISAEYVNGLRTESKSRADALAQDLTVTNGLLDECAKRFRTARQELLDARKKELETAQASLSEFIEAVGLYRTRREDKKRATMNADNLSASLQQDLAGKVMTIAGLNSRVQEELAALTLLRKRRSWWKDLLEKCGEGKILDLKLQQNVLSCFSSRVNYFLRLLTWRPEGKQEITSAKFFSILMQLGEGETQTPKIKQDFFHGTESMGDEAAEAEMLMKQQTDSKEKGNLHKVKPVRVNKQALSTSEYMRCHLAFFLAYGEMFEERHGVAINLRVFDECFSGMDAYGVAMVLQTLEYLRNRDTSSSLKDEGGEPATKKQRELPFERSFIVAAISPMLHILFKWGRVYMLTDKATVEQL